MIKRQSSITIEDAFNMFKSYKVGVQKPTLENYEVTYAVFLRDTGLSESSPIRFITEEVVVSWINLMKANNVRLSSINHYISDIRVFLNWCMKQDYIRKFKISLIKGQESIMRYYTDEELDVLIKKPTKSELFSQHRTWVAICFVLATGARASTLINIKISDIDFNNNEVTYRHLKNKHVAVIPLSKSLSRIIREYLSSWSREKEDGWLFCDAAENQCTVSSLYQALDNYCNRRGIKSKGMHALRHSFARGYIMNGGNAFKLQKLLTHSTLEMTKRYVRLFSDDLKTDYESFSPLDNMTVTKKATIRRA